MKAVEIKKLTYTYECAQSPSLDGIDLSIERGSCVLLAGASGSGKSTLLNCINGLNPIHYGGERSGVVQVMDNDVADLRLWEIADFVGTVFQNPNTQFFQCNVEDELAFGMEYRGFSAQEIDDRISKYVERMRISEILHRDIFSISSGERQKVAVAAVSSLGADVLLFDEPSANLDSSATRDLADILYNLKSEGRTIIISEHRIHYLRQLIDRVIVLDNGNIQYDGSPEVLNDDNFRNKFGLRAWSFANLIEPDQSKEDLTHSAILHAENITLKKKNSAPLVNNASIQVRTGECVGIIGPNGAGKTTLARILAGLEVRTEGTVELDGVKLPPKKRIGKIVYMPQQADQQLFADSVYEELALSLKDIPNSDDRINEILKGFDLLPLADKHPHALSGGEKQRVAIAAMIAMRPRILILDEPTSGMDGRRMQQFATEIQKLLDIDCAIFIITHDFELITECCNRLIWMENGSTTTQYAWNDLDQVAVWFGCPEVERKAKICSN